MNQKKAPLTPDQKSGRGEPVDTSNISPSFKNGKGTVFRQISKTVKTEDVIGMPFTVRGFTLGLPRLRSGASI
jgi:hypothetical protein